MIEPGDEAVVLKPYYDAYAVGIEMVGAGLSVFVPEGTYHALTEISNLGCAGSRSNSQQRR